MMPALATDSDPLVLAIDQGTSATKAVLVNRTGMVIDRASAPVGLQHPQPGWAEQDPLEIWATVQRVVGLLLADRDPSRVVAVGLSTQRESTMVWERGTGRPLGPLLGWQDNRGAAVCDRLRAAGHASTIAEITGLPLDAMFSASKATVLLDHYDPGRTRSLNGELCLGTVDSWLLWQLGGEHLVESGNASRTQLLNINTRRWEPWLLDLFAIPVQALPTVVASSGPFVTCRHLDPLPPTIPVTGVLGDSHAALFARAGWRPGQVKVTYGTGSSVMGLSSSRLAPDHGVARTIAWELTEPVYALEGNIRSSGATIAWLARLFGTTAAQIADRGGTENGGVVLVPAFNGLGAPWWDDRVRAIITGLSDSTTLDQIARAALESIAFQVEDVVAAIERAGNPVAVINADGGPSSNPGLMQLQADTSGRQVIASPTSELSALGAAHLAGLGVGWWTIEDLDELTRDGIIYDPQGDPDRRRDNRRDWHVAVDAARGIARSTQPQ